MKDVQNIDNLENPGSNYDRRNFLKTTGQGLVAATIISQLTPSSAGAQTTQKQVPVSELPDTKPIELKLTDAASEKPNPPTPSPLRPERRIGYAIVGLGEFALNQILPSMGNCKYSKPVALVSGDAAKAQKVATQYGIPQKNIYNYQNFDTIKNNPEIDVVYIILPNSMHEEFTIRAAKAGKHVLCEKPMATTTAAAQRMIDACKTAGKKLMIAYRIQYEPNNRQVMKWTREQTYGKVRVINTFNAQNIGDPDQWRLKKDLAGGGSLPDIGIYNFNTARYLLGEEPETVIASIYTTPGDPCFKEVEETVLFQLIFPSGAVANNTCSYGVHESRYYRCHADNGAYFGIQNAFAYNGLQLELSKVEGKMEMKSEPSLGGEKNQFALEIDHMSQCILFNKTPFTPGEEGLQDHKITDAIYEAERTGKPVKMARIEKKDAFRGDAPMEEA